MFSFCENQLNLLRRVSNKNINKPLKLLIALSTYNNVVIKRITTIESNAYIRMYVQKH